MYKSSVRGKLYKRGLWQAYHDRIEDVLKIVYVKTTLNQRTYTKESMHEDEANDVYQKIRVYDNFHCSKKNK